MKKQHGFSTNKFSRPYLWAICRQRGGAVAAEERGGEAFEGEEEEAAEKDCARDAGREGHTRGEEEAEEKRGEQSERTRYPARVHAHLRTTPLVHLAKGRGTRAATLFAKDGMLKRRQHQRVRVYIRD